MYTTVNRTWHEEGKNKEEESLGIWSEESQQHGRTQGTVMQWTTGWQLIKDEQEEESV
jgi:hypothetical protein